jgi:hypothetical protein
MADVLLPNLACNPWLLVGICTYGHCRNNVVDALIEPMTEVVFSSMPLDESRNIFQSVLAKQFCSIASALSDHSILSESLVFPALVFACTQESGG